MCIFALEIHLRASLAHFLMTHASLGNIIIIDDDAAITDLLNLNLKSEGYAVRIIPRSADVTEADLRDAHLVIIDASDQEPTGCDFIADMRALSFGERLGVIFYSTMESERSLIDALDAGADDVVRKPFSLREILARVRAVMRRRCRAAATIADADIVNFKQMKIDFTVRAAYISGEPLNLSNTEFAILELLLRNANSYTPRIEIFKSVWPDGMGANERIVDTNISRLRRKLGPLGSCIVNRSGMGYMLAE